MQGISQEMLAEALDLTFHQVQKYERGANRVSASRLFELSQIFDVPISYFFEDVPAKTNGHHREFALREESDLMTKRETLEFVRAFYRIKDPAVRKNILNLNKTMDG